MQLRIADAADVPALQKLITRSGLGLSEPYYTREQTEAVTRHVFRVDSQLVIDRTYLLIESPQAIVACGGWSKRRTLFCGDQGKRGSDTPLDAPTEPGRTPALLVDPTIAPPGLPPRLLG